MVVVGADVHKRSHTFVAVDAVGKQLGQLTARRPRKGITRRWGGSANRSRVRWCGRSRIVGICRPGWSGTC